MGGRQSVAAPRPVVVRADDWAGDGLRGRAAGEGRLRVAVRVSSPRGTSPTPGKVIVKVDDRRGALCVCVWPALESRHVIDAWQVIPAAQNPVKVLVCRQSAGL